MLRFFNHLRSPRRESGFSLPELIAVITLMGILAAITVPGFAKQRQNGIDQKVRSDMVAANVVIESWIIRHPARQIPSGEISGTAAGVSVSGSLTNAGLRGFKASTGTKLVVTGKTDPLGTYTIVGTNDAGNISKTSGLTYDSSQGGF